MVFKINYMEVPKSILAKEIKCVLVHNKTQYGFKQLSSCLLFVGISKAELISLLTSYKGSNSY